MPYNDGEKLNEGHNSLPTQSIPTPTNNRTIHIQETDDYAYNDELNEIKASIARTSLELKKLELNIIAEELEAQQQLEIQEKEEQLRLQRQQPHTQQLQQLQQLQHFTETSSIDDNKDVREHSELPSTSKDARLLFSNPNKPSSSSPLLNATQPISTSIFPIVLLLEDQPVTLQTIPTLPPPPTPPSSPLLLKITELKKSTDIEAGSGGVHLSVDQPSVSYLLSPRRKRPRRVYIAAPRRLATLRSQRVESDNAEYLFVPPVPLPSPSSTSPAKSQSKEAVDEPKPFANNKSDYLNPDIFNLIEPLEYEEPKPSKRRRGGANTRKRVTKPRSPSLGLNLVKAAEVSPTKSATLCVSQLNLDSPPPSSSTSPIKKKRTRNMSLYDRRYQTADERRGAGVGNGYMSSSTRNSSAGSASGTHSDIEQQDMSGQYYITSSNTSAGGIGLNGSLALNHAPSMGTLCNIGNTCYLNSVVYTLRFAPHFLHNLHHLLHDLNNVQQILLRQRNTKSSSLGRGVSAPPLESNRSVSNKDLPSMEQYNSPGSSSGGDKDNPTVRTCHQALMEKLHDLYQNLTQNEVTDSSEPFHADTLLHAIQDVNATFEGNQQQDAHEFLMCLMDSLSEANQMLVKAIGECPEIIANGYIANLDEMEANFPADKDSIASASGGNAPSGGGGSTSTTSSSSLTSKASFFSRKSKRKEEAKNAKASRLQSPLKDGHSVAGSSGTTAQSSSNSLFYLNTVDLSGSHSTQSVVGATTSTTKSISDDESKSTIKSIQEKEKERLAEKIRELNLDFFTHDFEGVCVLTTRCLSCDTITKQKQGMLDISLPVPLSGHDTPDYIEKPSQYIQNTCITREFFRGENKYSCDTCTGYTEAIRSISYEVLPRLLLIQLNRFSGGMEKINTYVPTTFTLPCFCAKCCELNEGNKLHVYKLYSVITHVGATLTVGHYIAYTCCLEWANEYVNCPKDRRNMSPSQHTSGSSSGGADGGSVTPVSAATSAASALASSGTSLMKKMKFGRSKASSSGDMSKNVKQLNGLTSKAITNGIGKLSMNSTCHSLSCCAMRFSRGIQPPLSAGGNNNSASSSDFSEESAQNGANSSYSGGGNNSSGSAGNTSFPSGYGSTGRGGTKHSYINPGAEPIWYMCDDDKIKAMTQREFEDLLSPTRKITITPYLLFYARFDLQPTQSTSASSKPTNILSSSTTIAGSSASSSQQQPSWSQENLQSGSSSGSVVHKI